MGIIWQFGLAKNIFDAQKYDKIYLFASYLLDYFVSKCQLWVKKLNGIFFGIFFWNFLINRIEDFILKCRRHGIMVEKKRNSIMP